MDNMKSIYCYGFRVSFREPGRRPRTGKVLKDVHPMLKIRADRLHIWETEEDLIYMVDKSIVY